MKIKDGVMFMSRMEWSDLAVRGQILESAEGERVLYQGYAHKIEIVCDNNVQFAYNEFEEHRKTLENSLTLEERAAYFNKNLELARGVFYAIAEETEDTNPRLRQAVDSGSYDNWYLFDSTKCFVDRNWQIYPKGTRCQQCGEVHHLPTMKSYPCGLSWSVSNSPDTYSWTVFDTETKEVLASDSADSHQEAINLAESELEELAGK